MKDLEKKKKILVKKGSILTFTKDYQRLSSFKQFIVHKSTISKCGRFITIVAAHPINNSTTEIATNIDINQCIESIDWSYHEL